MMLSPPYDCNDYERLLDHDSVDLDFLLGLDDEPVTDEEIDDLPTVEELIGELEDLDEDWSLLEDV